MTTESLPDHSALGASSMHRWDKCPGSVRLSAGIVAPTSIYAAEGTLAHEIAAECLESGTTADGYIGASYDVEGHKIEVTEEMTDAVAVYLRAIRGDYAEFPARPERLVEHKFHLKELHPDLYGTADCVQLDRKQKLLRVYDYKHGAGKVVEVANNPQLLYYALGALLSSGADVADVEIVIIQPRCPHSDGPVRRHKIPARELMAFSADLLAAVARTEAPDAPLAAGDHCRFCPASAICPERKRVAQETAKREFSPAAPYDPQELADTLKLLPVIEGWAESVRQFAYAEAEHGRCPPGFKLVDKRPTRKWKADDHTIEVELGKIGLAESDVYAPRKLQSPAQIEKVIGKAKKNADKLAVVSGLCEAVSSGTTLVPESDNRAAVKRSAKDDFANV